MGTAPPRGQGTTERRSIQWSATNVTLTVRPTFSTPETSPTAHPGPASPCATAACADAEAREPQAVVVLGHLAELVQQHVFHTLDRGLDRSGI